MAEPEKIKKSGKGKLIVITLLVLLLLAGGGFAAFKFGVPGLLSPMGSDQAAGGEGQAAGGNATAQAGGGNAAGAAGAGGAAAGNQIVTSTVTLPTFLVNLQDPIGRRFIKLNMDIEVTGQGVNEEIQKMMPRIKDSVNMLLSSKSYADLASIENKLLLKNEIVERINLILGGSKVKQVYFNDLIIQ